MKYIKLMPDCKIQIFDLVTSNLLFILFMFYCSCTLLHKFSKTLYYDTSVFKTRKVQPIERV